MEQNLTFRTFKIEKNLYPIYLHPAFKYPNKGVLTLLEYVVLHPKDT